MFTPPCGWGCACSLLGGCTLRMRSCCNWNTSRSPATSRRASPSSGDSCSTTRLLPRGQLDRDRSSRRRDAAPLQPHGEVADDRGADPRRRATCRTARRRSTACSSSAASSSRRSPTASETSGDVDRDARPRRKRLLSPVTAERCRSATSGTSRSPAPSRRSSARSGRTRSAGPTRRSTRASCSSSVTQVSTSGTSAASTSQAAERAAVRGSSFNAARSRGPRAIRSTWTSAPTIAEAEVERLSGPARRWSRRRRARTSRSRSCETREGNPFCVG